jgi:hypothetical protein
VISDFLATNYPGAGGLSLHEVREALLVFVQQKELAALEVTAYNPTKDPDGSGAKLIVDLLAEALGARLEALKGSEAAVAAAAPAAAAAAASQGSDSSSAKKAAEPELSTPSPGEAWSSESLEEPSDLESDSESTDDDSKDSGASEESSGSHS